MKKFLIMTAGCLIMFGTVQAYATDETADKDQKADPSKAVKSDKKGKVQTLCPVMGGEIDRNLYADVKGKRIYVCCGGCVEKIKSNPDKYIRILEDQGIEIEKAPAASSK